MVEPILCLVCCVMLLWVCMLKLDLSALQKANRALQEQVHRLTRELKKGVTVEGGRRLQADELTLHGRAR